MWCRHSELTKIQFGKLALISANSSFAQVEHSREYTFAVKKRFAVHASNISQVTLAEYSPRFWCERSFRALIPGVRCIRHVAERYFFPQWENKQSPYQENVWLQPGMLSISSCLFYILVILNAALDSQLTAQPGPTGPIFTQLWTPSIHFLFEILRDVHVGSRFSIGLNP